MNQQDIEDLDHYEMKEEEPVDGKKSEDDGIEKENLAILEKIRKNQRQDHLNVSWYWVIHFVVDNSVWSRTRLHSRLMLLKLHTHCIEYVFPT